MNDVWSKRYWGGSAELNALAEKIQAIEFDHPFILDGSTIGGNIRDAEGYWAPNVLHSTDDDIWVDGEPWQGSEWSAITGMTGQHGYNGAVFHSSEFIGSAIAERMSELSEETPQVFVIVACEVEASDDEVHEVADEMGLDTSTDAGWETARDAADGRQEPAGWVILYRDATGEACKF